MDNARKKQALKPLKLCLQKKKISFYTYTFSRTIPLAWEAPPKGLAFRAVPKCAFLYPLSCHLWSRRWFLSLRAVLKPLGFPWKKQVIAIEWLGWRLLFIRVFYVVVNGTKYEKPQNTCALTHLPTPRTNEENGPQCTAWIYTDYYGLELVWPSGQGIWLACSIMSRNINNFSHLLHPFWNHWLSLQCDWFSAVRFIPKSHYLLL